MLQALRGQELLSSEAAASFVWLSGFPAPGACWKGGEVSELGPWAASEVTGNPSVSELQGPRPALLPWGSLTLVVCKSLLSAAVSIPGESGRIVRELLDLTEPAKRSSSWEFVKRSGAGGSVFTWA